MKIDNTLFGRKLQGNLITLYRLQNRNGMEVYLTSYGCRLVSIQVPDKSGNKRNVILGYGSLEEYQTDRDTYMGATVGRYANRIADASFDLEGRRYSLINNNGNNHLHGGYRGFDSFFWDAVQTGPARIEMRYTSPDGQEGFPGTLEVIAVIELDDTNTLSIKYTAKSDALTIVNLTNHAYFNFSGTASRDIFNHQMAIHADQFTPVDERLIPTGELRSVEGSCFDFRQMKAIGADLDFDDDQVALGHGYDHNFVLNQVEKDQEGLYRAADVLESESGIRMTLWTDQPGVQLYTANFIPPNKGLKDEKFTKNGAFCLEPQAFPDSPNIDHFPDVRLKAGQLYSWHSKYEFGLL